VSRIPLPRAVLFDLDGTLSDSLPDIAWALNEAREMHGLPSATEAEVRPWVGGGAEVLVVRSVGAKEASDPRVAPLLADFLAVYEAHASDRSVLYPGVRELLEFLRSRGVKIAVTTNKPAGACEALLQGLGIAAFFDAVVTPESSGLRKPDPRFLEAALRRLGVAAKDALVVGDGTQDVQAAKAAGIPCVALTGGYAEYAALRALEAEYYFASVKELASLLR
jgi:phosphoglycolate phosphatase